MASLKFGKDHWTFTDFIYLRENAASNDQTVSRNTVIGKRQSKMKQRKKKREKAFYIWIVLLYICL